MFDPGISLRALGSLHIFGFSLPARAAPACGPRPCQSLCHALGVLSFAAPPPVTGLAAVESLSCLQLYQHVGSVQRAGFVLAAARPAVVGFALMAAAAAPLAAAAAAAAPLAAGLVLAAARPAVVGFALMAAAAAPVAAAGAAGAPLAACLVLAAACPAVVGFALMAAAAPLAAAYVLAAVPPAVGFAIAAALAVVELLLTAARGGSGGFALAGYDPAADAADAALLAGSVPPAGLAQVHAAAFALAAAVDFGLIAAVGFGLVAAAFALVAAAFALAAAVGFGLVAAAFALAAAVDFGLIAAVAFALAAFVGFAPTAVAAFAPVVVESVLAVVAAAAAAGFALAGSVLADDAAVAALRTGSVPPAGFAQLHAACSPTANGYPSPLGRLLEACLPLVSGCALARAAAAAVHFEPQAHFGPDSSQGVT